MASVTAVRSFLLTAVALCAFAANSVLCRLALDGARIDPATFTTVRILSGALALWLILVVRGRGKARSGDWTSAGALAAYAVAFSFAYVGLTAATGALLLFASVQATMIGRGLWVGERLDRQQSVGVTLAAAGLLGLLLPGLAAPPPWSAALMILAGVAWGVYSLRGRAAADAIATTAGNFLRAVPIACLVSVLTWGSASADATGIWLAVASGVVASGFGYVVWYAVLPHLRAATAASVQLAVPLLAAGGGLLLIGEPLTARFLLAACAILGGLALVVVRRR